MATSQSILAVIRAVGPGLNTAKDRVAFAVHAAFFAMGHLLIAFGPTAFAEDAFSTTSDDEVRINGRWNMMEGLYAFMYSKPDRPGPNKVVVKCRGAHDKLVVEVLKESAPFPLRLELTIEEFAHDCGGQSNYFAQYKNLRRFAEILNREIFDKLYDSPVRSRSLSTVVSLVYKNKSYTNPLTHVFCTCEGVQKNMPLISVSTNCLNRLFNAATLREIPELTGRVEAGKELLMMFIPAEIQPFPLHLTDLIRCLLRYGIQVVATGNSSFAAGMHCIVQTDATTVVPLVLMSVDDDRASV